jgi:uncharacterized protein
LSAIFADTSALVKDYVAEVGSAWVNSWADRSVGNIVIISRLTTVELIAGLARRQRELSISSVDFAIRRNSFLKKVVEFYLVMDLDDDVLTPARDLVTRYPLRTLDAIQLASALATGLTVVSADTRLLAAAAAEGLATDDPNAHP